MTDEQQKEIERLAGEAYDAAVALSQAGMSNSSGGTFEDQRTRAIAYAVARAKAAEAHKDLEDAIKALGGERT